MYDVYDEIKWVKYWYITSSPIAMLDSLNDT